MARRAGPGFGLALVLAATGCSEQPSVELRWTLVSDPGISADDAPPLTSVVQCSSVGVSRVRVTTLADSEDMCDVVVDEREFPCHPSSFPVDGPILEPGDYTVLVQGLRRSGEPWPCEDVSPCEDDPTCIARDSLELSVVEGETETAELALLLEPPQCDDGIDNDKDGRVDISDPACLLPEGVNDAGVEDAERGLTIFQLSASFLDNDEAKPKYLDVSTIRVDSVNLDDPSDTIEWFFSAESADPFPLLSEGYSPGNYVLRATALNKAGVALTEAIRASEDSAGDNPNPDCAPDSTFCVQEDAAAYVVDEFRFTDDRFFDPIVGRIIFSQVLLLDPERTSPCVLVDTGDRVVAIDRLRVRVASPDTGYVDLDTLGFTGSHPNGSLMPVDEGDGWISFACPTSRVTSLPVVWGAYTMEVQAMIGNEICFQITESDGSQKVLAPREGTNDQAVELPRVLDASGDIPAGCVECEVDLDCGTHSFCAQGLCFSKESSSD